MSAESLADRLDAQIRDHGPIPVSAYVDAALYDEHGGFYTAAGGRAGRRGDFLTAPEVGPLFGAVVARAVDRWWTDAGRPDRFVVEEWGAGPGTLARAIVAAAPEVLTSGALVWVHVEVSAAQRAGHLDHPALRSVAPGNVDPTADVILANELLDNLAFDVIERVDGTWREVLVDRRGSDGRFTLARGAPVEQPPGAAVLADATRLPIPGAAIAWVGAARRRAPLVVAFDYGADITELAARGDGWLRTHAGHDGRADWLAAPGTCDITIDVPVDLLPTPDGLQPQASWLRAHGIDALVDEGRRTWEASAAIGDLTALKARSRIREADALLDPDGMGGYLVWEWRSSRPVPGVGSR